MGTTTKMPSTTTSRTTTTGTTTKPWTTTNFADTTTAGTTTTGTTPTGTTTTSTTTTSTTTTGTTTTGSTTESCSYDCSGQPDGHYAEADCWPVFCDCVGGVGTIKYCQAGTVFNDVLGYCTNPQNTQGC